MNITFINTSEMSEIYWVEFQTLHRETFPYSKTSSLKLKYFKNYLIEIDEVGSLTCCLKDDKMVGFVYGKHKKKIVYTWRILNVDIWYCVKLFINDIVGFMTNFQFYVLSNLLQKKVSGISSMRLIAIGVSKAYQGTGISEVIKNKFEQSIRDYSHYGLSVHSHNNRAIKFYEKSAISSSIINKYLWSYEFKNPYFIK